jgi:hypothetical protein
LLLLLLLLFVYVFPAAKFPVHAWIGWIYPFVAGGI